MANVETLESLPEIDMLADEGITLESLQREMIADYEAYYKELTGDELILYPADSRRILINVAAGKLYQLAAIMNERHKQNFLQYMYGEFTKNWAANFGFRENGVEKATVTLRFHLATPQKTDVMIPAGTRATSGNQVFFATDEELVIPAGEMYADTSATCTISGTVGNGHMVGQINILADPINLIESVENTSNSVGGHDEYTNLELKNLIYNFPATYSTAGPEECYAALAKKYSANIADVRVISNKQAVVQIYLLLQNGNIPDAEYCQKVCQYIYSSGVIPDTDKVEVLAPEIVPYEIVATYYISEIRKDIANGIKESIEEAAIEFKEYTEGKIGRAINPGALNAYVSAAGAFRIEINTPTYKALKEIQVAVCSGITLEYGGLEKE